jgi:hypothetical protein
MKREDVIQLARGVRFLSWHRIARITKVHSPY